MRWRRREPGEPEETPQGPEPEPPEPEPEGEPEEAGERGGDECRVEDAPPKPHAAEERYATCTACWRVTHERYGPGVLYEYEDKEVVVVLDQRPRDGTPRI